MDSDSLLDPIIASARKRVRILISKFKNTRSTEELQEIQENHQPAPVSVPEWLEPFHDRMREQIAKTERQQEYLRSLYLQGVVCINWKIESFNLAYRKETIEKEISMSLRDALLSYMTDLPKILSNRLALWDQHIAQWDTKWLEKDFEKSERHARRAREELLGEVDLPVADIPETTIPAEAEPVHEDANQLHVEAVETQQTPAIAAAQDIIDLSDSDGIEELEATHVDVDSDRSLVDMDDEIDEEDIDEEAEYEEVDEEEIDEEDNIDEEVYQEFDEEVEGASDDQYDDEVQMIDEIVESQSESEADEPVDADEIHKDIVNGTESHEEILPESSIMDYIGDLNGSVEQNAQYADQSFTSERFMEINDSAIHEDFNEPHDTPDENAKIKADSTDSLQTRETSLPKYEEEGEPNIFIEEQIQLNGQTPIEPINLSDFEETNDNEHDSQHAHHDNHEGSHEMEFLDDSVHPIGADDGTSEPQPKLEEEVVYQLTQDDRATKATPHVENAEADRTVTETAQLNTESVPAGENEKAPFTQPETAFASDDDDMQIRLNDSVHSDAHTDPTASPEPTTPLHTVEEQRSNESKGQEDADLEPASEVHNDWDISFTFAPMIESTEEVIETPKKSIRTTLVESSRAIASSARRMFMNSPLFNGNAKPVLLPGDSNSVKESARKARDMLKQSPLFSGNPPKLSFSSQVQSPTHLKTPMSRRKTRLRRRRLEFVEPDEDLGSKLTDGIRRSKRKPKLRY